MTKLRLTPPTLRAATVLLAALAFVISPAFTDGFSGFDPELFPEPQRNPPVQPAGYAFGIWGLIYLWLLAHGAVGLAARRDDPDWDAARWPLIGSLAVGAGWIAVANASAVWATVMIWAMLAGAVLALLRAPRGDGLARWIGTAPLGIYAGWLTAASCVSIGLMLGGYGLSSPRAAALIALGVAVVLGLTVQLKLGRAPEYGLTLIWALVGVVVANTGQDALVIGAAGVGIVAAAAAVWQVARPVRP